MFGARIVALVEGIRHIFRLDRQRVRILYLVWQHAATSDQVLTVHRISGVRMRSEEAE